MVIVFFSAFYNVRAYLVWVSLFYHADSCGYMISTCDVRTWISFGQHYCTEQCRGRFPPLRTRWHCGFLCFSDVTQSIWPETSCQGQDKKSPRATYCTGRHTQPLVWAKSLHLVFCTVWKSARLYSVFFIEQFCQISCTIFFVPHCTWYYVYLWL